MIVMGMLMSTVHHCRTTYSLEERRKYDVGLHEIFFRVREKYDRETDGGPNKIDHIPS